MEEEMANVTHPKYNFWYLWFKIKIFFRYNFPIQYLNYEIGVLSGKKFFYVKNHKGGMANPGTLFKSFHSGHVMELKERKYINAPICKNILFFYFPDFIVRFLRHTVGTYRSGRDATRA